MKIYIAALILTLSFGTVFAKSGDNGFDGGISTGGVLTPLTNTSKTASASQTYPYKEVVFITGTPLVFNGTVTISKATRGGTETYTYSYSLTNGVKNKLTRSCLYEAAVTENNSQVIRIMTTKVGSKPKETIIINGITYTLDSIGGQKFSLSTINDIKPACNYYAGNWNSEKVYTTKDGRRITVAMGSQMYGYDQYWGATETQEISIRIKGLTEQKGVYDSWGGNGSIKISTTTSNKLIYMDNKPDAISFEGGYLRKQENNSILSYDLSLPLLDSHGIATDNIVNYNDILDLSSFPMQERLAVVDTSNIKGNWYEENVKQLSSLGIIDGSYITDYREFENPITRKEFAKAVAESVKLSLMEIPVEIKQKLSRAKQEPVEKLPFWDVSSDDEYYVYIFTLYKKGVMGGTSQNTFAPDQPLSRAEALVIFIRMLGLDSTLQNALPITYFMDNDNIPDWARNAALVAAKIGIVQGDENNNLNPNAHLTKAEAVTLLNNFISYMRDNMVRDYRDKIINY